eukprot:6266229-Alexandrium_andersonii.AAC.2
MHKCVLRSCDSAAVRASFRSQCISTIHSVALLRSWVPTRLAAVQGEGREHLQGLLVAGERVTLNSPQLVS